MADEQADPVWEAAIAQSQAELKDKKRPPRERFQKAAEALLLKATPDKVKPATPLVIEGMIPDGDDKKRQAFAYLLPLHIGFVLLVLEDAAVLVYRILKFNAPQADGTGGNDYVLVDHLEPGVPVPVG